MSLEKMREELQLQKMEVAKAEMQFKIEQRKQDIERLQEELNKQSAAIEEAKEKLQG